MDNELSGSIHFVGIGGIGVSALARFYKSRGVRVSGSDLQPSEITEELAREGIRIAVGKHKAANVPNDASRVIRTAAAPPTNPEVKRANTKKIPVQTYAEAL